MKAFAVWLFFVGATSGFAADQKFIYVGGGLLNTPIHRAGQKDRTQVKSWGDTYGMLSVQARFGGGRWGFVPSFVGSPLARSSSDDAISIRSYALLAPFAYRLNSIVGVKLGPGMFFRSLVGKGGEVELPNGLGTSTFYRPSTTTVTSSWLIDGGVDIFATMRWVVAADLLMTSALSSRRAVGGMLLIQYGVL